MYCTNCGTQIADDARFCKNCGTPTGHAQMLHQGKVPTDSAMQQTGAPMYTDMQGQTGASMYTDMQGQGDTPVHSDMQQSGTKPHVQAQKKKGAKGKPGSPKKLMIAGISAVVLVCLTGIVMVLRLFNHGNGAEVAVKEPETTMEAGTGRVQDVPAEEMTDETELAGMEHEAAAGETEQSKEEDGEKTDPVELLREFESNLPYVSLEGLQYSYSDRSDDGIWETSGLEATDGVISDRLMDLDQDGEAELLVFRIEGYQNPDHGNYYHNLVAEAYEVIGDEVICSDSEVVSAGILADNMENVRVILKDNHFLCVDTCILTFLSADGAYGNMNLSFYNGNEWVSMSECSYAGSDWMDAGKGYEQEIFCGDLRTLGLYKTADLMSKWDHYFFSTADPGMEVLFKIRVDNNNYDHFDPHKASVFSTVHMVVPDPQTDYFCEDSAQRVLQNEEIASLTKEQLRIARNEIYARNGWNFEDEALRNYFNDKAWYRPCWDIGNIDDTGLTDVEIANRDLLVNAEK